MGTGACSTVISLPRGCFTIRRFSCGFLHEKRAHDGTDCALNSDRDVTHLARLNDILCQIWTAGSTIDLL